jgi:hypothetical protein
MARFCRDLNEIVQIYTSSNCSNNNAVACARRREKLGINLCRHEQRPHGGASNQVDPDRAPAVRSLQRAHCKQSNRSSDGTSAIDQAGNRSKRLVVSADRRMRRQISRDSRRDDIVGSVCHKEVK